MKATKDETIMCDDSIEATYSFKVIAKEACLIIDVEDMFWQMHKDLKQDKNKAVIATKFHNSIARIVVDVAKRISRKTKCKDIALSGGVFQNNFLRRKVNRQLSASGFNVFMNKKVPVNDLNISLGQYYVSSSTRKS